MVNTDSKCYIKAKKMLDEFVANGGNVDDLGNKDEIYRYIKSARITDASGNSLDVEAKFELLGHPRARARCKDSRQQLVEEVDEYKRSGKSFHITRKNLPFYPRLHTYARKLQYDGISLSYDQIMKGLGYKDYSDIYFRCMGISALANYRDENGFVDSYRQDEQLKAYITGLSEYLGIPYYLVVTLLANENLENCYIATEYIAQVKAELQQFCLQNGSLKGLRTQNRRLYNKLDTLMKSYGDGNETILTRQDWMVALELDGFENGFKKSSKVEVDIKPIMHRLKQKFGDKVIGAKDIDSKDYYHIYIKSVKLGVPVKELFREYGLNYKGNTSSRLSNMKVNQIPYLNQMRTFRDRLLEAQGFTDEKRYCKEEIFEARVKACQLAYDKFKDKMFNFTSEEEYADEEKMGL